MRALAVAAVATLALGACGQPAASSGGAPPAARPAALSDRTVCLDLQPPSTDTTDPGTVLGASMPAGFAECSTATEAVPGDGEWLVRQERHADVDTAALAAALRLPDEPPPKGSLACALYLDLSPEVYAVDAAGSATRVRWPRDACHHLRPEAKAADKALRWRTVGTRKLRRITPQGAIDTGCTSSWKDIPVLEAAEGVHRIQVGTLGSLGVAGSARSCTYRVPEDGSEAVGDFEKGGRLE
ncbi:MAG TPA: hypothetical protein VE781_13850, partial [Kineosporiaceae bacterium]|nr:hypothetical protein [Kineosporiaceae bacterium]